MKDKINTEYKVGDLIYDANIYDGMNTNLNDLQFYKKWLPKNKNAKILELCCGTGRLTIPIAKEYNICGIDNSSSMLKQANLIYIFSCLGNFLSACYLCISIK